MGPDLDSWLRRYELGREISSRLAWLVPLLVGGAFIAMSMQLIASRLLLAIEGEIVDAVPHCAQPLGNRCRTSYIISGHHPDRPFKYEASGDESSLARDLRPGDFIEKRPWQLAYRVNGREVDDFPLFAVLVLQTVVALALIWWIRRACKRSAL